jgi:exosortase/archaeosortase family protein
VLRAAQIPAVPDGVLVHLSRVRLEVEEWCSGLVSMKWLSLLAGILAVVAPHVGLGWRVALVLVAPLIALEVNILRVAAIGAGIEWGGLGYTNTVKEWTGWVAPVLGTAQVIALGLVARRR